MLKIVNTVVAVEEDCTVTTHTVEGTAVLGGDSIWDYNYNKNGYEVIVEQIDVFEYEDYKTVNVTHKAGWEIYTDTGFEASISELLGFEVAFTEQGMQEDEFASLEA